MRFNLLTVRLYLFTIRFSVFTLRFSVFMVRFSIFTESFCVLLVPYRVIGVNTETFGSLVFELRSKTNIFYACPGQIPAETGIEHHQYLQGSEVDWVNLSDCWTELTEMDRVCFGSTSEVLNACLSCIGCLQCPCERFSVQQPENTNTDGKLALLTRVPPHPTFGTSAGSRNADCGPGFRRLRTFDRYHLTFGQLPGWSCQ